ncbi:uncharacterized protein LOC143909210 [Arctopsyche grandis]|uniref:uncharacterized protein LOC143909210 n=1 Tax=Arctopsyche grandis TaxID=121162 RepID=UPI00406D7C15
MDHFPAALYPLYKFFFVFGLAPYEMHRNCIPYVAATRSKTRLRISILIIIALSLASEYGRNYFVSSMSSTSKTAILILGLTTYFAGPVTSIATIIVYIFYASTFVNAINALYEVDVALISNGVVINYKSNIKCAFLTMLGIQAVIFYHDFQLYFIANPYQNLHLLLATLSLQLSSVFFGTIIGQYVVWTLVLHDRFVKLNSLIEKCDEDYYAGDVTIQGLPTRNTLKGFELCKVHKQLCEIIDKLAYVYSVPIVIQHGMLFLTLVVDTYFYYRNHVVSKTGSVGYHLASVLLTKDIFIVFLLYTVCSKSHAIISEAEKSGVILHNKTIWAKSKRAKKTISICSLQLFQQKAHFNICGMFPLDLSCFGSIIAFVTSYLIVYIQFQGSS